VGITYKIRRKEDGKFARQTRFYGPTNWGVGQVFIQKKAALSNFEDLIWKRENNFPWGKDYDDSNQTKVERKHSPKYWGTLELVKYESKLVDKDLMETHISIIKEE
jgi:hypothetical protein